jgi:hypothetical protein
MPKIKRTTPHETKPMRTPKEVIAGLLGFYRICSNAHCRRGRACRGEGQPCFATYWWQVPEELKVWVRTVISERCKGASVKDALAAGEADAQRYLDLQARLAAMQSPKPVELPPRREPPQPRVRTL